jgi:steroid 5-alpha reductase family enzyme
MNVLHLVIFAAMMGAALSAVVAVAWQVQLTTGNTGWIDVFWTFGLGAVAIILAWCRSRTVPGRTHVRSWLRSW